jgi:hypothetical protein
LCANRCWRPFGAHTFQTRLVTANLEPGEDGTFTVRITNASAPSGVRLTDVVLHLTVSPSTVAQMKGPGNSILATRLQNDIDSPALRRDALVDEMFIFFQDGDFEPNATLDVGEQNELEIGYRAVAAGNAEISAHVHASVDVESLLPRGNGTDGRRSLTVRS